MKGLFDGMKIKKAIIICPATLKNYWKDELSNWCPKIPIWLLDKNSDWKKLMKKLKDKGGILICSYGMVSTSRMLITEARYDILVIDEGHKTKNIDTELRRNAMQIAVKFHWLLLTGTPL